MGSLVKRTNGYIPTDAVRVGLLGIVGVALLGSGCSLRPRLGDVTSGMRETLAEVVATAPSEGPEALGSILAASGQRETPAPAPAAQDEAVAAERVPVHFRGADPARRYEVSAPSGEKCALPCALQLPRGQVLLTVDGDGTHAESVEVPQAGGTLEVTVAPRGRVLLAGVLMGGGLIVGAVGAALAPMLGGVPLLIGAGVALALVIPGYLLSQGNVSSLKWVSPATSRSTVRHGRFHVESRLGSGSSDPRRLVRFDDRVLR